MVDLDLKWAGEAALRALEGRWRDGGRPYAPERLTALYDEDALFFGGLAHHAVGAGQIRDYFDFYRSSIAASEIAFRDQAFLRLAPDTIAAQGFVDFTFGLPDGRVTHLTQRSTLVLVRSPTGEWRVRLQHFSVPPSQTPVPT
jgi:ketosteroid isomerase-like protein